MKKTLSAVNLDNKCIGLKRQKMHHSLEYVARNYRQLIFDLGYDSSLLLDTEILAFGELIYDYEKNKDDYLLEVLDFLSI